MASKSGLEIQRDLERLVSKWRSYTGSERSEAQTFLSELYAAYGTDRTAAGASFEDFRSSAGFMDLHQPGVLIVEMKKPSRSLEEAAERPVRGWSALAPTQAVPARQGAGSRGPTRRSAAA